MKNLVYKISKLLLRNPLGQALANREGAYGRSLVL